MKLLPSFRYGMKSMEERPVELRHDGVGVGAAAAFHH